MSASTRAALCSIQAKEHLAQALKITKSGKVTIGAKPERVADLVYFDADFLESLNFNVEVPAPHEKSKH